MRHVLPEVRYRNRVAPGRQPQVVGRASLIGGRQRRPGQCGPTADNVALGQSTFGSPLGLSYSVRRPDPLTNVGFMTDAADFAAASDDVGDDTDFWMSLPGIRESLVEAAADCAGGRTYGEAEVRARFGLPPRTST